jgi:hypothetical protein
VVVAAVSAAGLSAVVGGSPFPLLFPALLLHIRCPFWRRVRGEKWFWVDQWRAISILFAPALRWGWRHGGLLRVESEFSIIALPIPFSPYFFRRPLCVESWATRAEGNTILSVTFVQSC